MVDLRSLCVKNNWFTGGSNEQYKKLLVMGERGCSRDEIALVIWVCSSGWNLAAIKEELAMAGVPKQVGPGKNIIEIGGGYFQKGSSGGIKYCISIDDSGNFYTKLFENLRNYLSGFMGGAKEKEFTFTSCYDGLSFSFQFGGLSVVAIDKTTGRYKGSDCSNDKWEWAFEYNDIDMPIDLDMLSGILKTIMYGFEHGVRYPVHDILARVCQNGIYRDEKVLLRPLGNGEFSVTLV